MKKWIAKVLIILLGLLAAACGGTVAMQEVTVEVSNAGYVPDTVTIVIGQGTKLTLQNTDTREHDLGIEEIALVTSGGDSGTPGHNMTGMSGEMAEPLQLHLVAAAGSSSSLGITPSKAGEYEFRCRIAGHSEVGKLIVAQGS